MSAIRRLAVSATVRLWLPTGVVAAWWGFSAHSRSVYFPPLQTILDTFQHDWLFRLARRDLVPSVQDFIVGFLLAVVAGLIAGIAIAQSRWLRRAVLPYVHFLRSIPPPALLPFALVVIGVGTSMKVSVIALGAVWPTLLNTVDGIEGIEPRLSDVAAVYRLPRRHRLRYVTLRAASPQIFAGMRTTLQISIILIVVSEMVASTGGIGYYVLQSEQSFSVAQTWAGTILLGLLGYLANAGFSTVESRALRWQTNQRLRDRT